MIDLSFRGDLVRFLFKTRKYSSMMATACLLTTCASCLTGLDMSRGPCTGHACRRGKFREVPEQRGIPCEALLVGVCVKYAGSSCKGISRITATSVT